MTLGRSSAVMGSWIILALASLAGVIAMIALALRLARGARRWIRCSLAACVGGFGVLLGVWVPGEVLLRRAGKQSYQRTFPGQFEDNPAGVTWAWKDPVLGWTGVPCAPDTNRQGFRDRRDFVALQPDPATRRVMILGDSFVWGSSVEADETIPALLERELGAGFECFNLGVTAWGIDQMFLAYQRYKDAILPDVVVLAFIDDDVRRVLEAYRLFERMNKPCFEIRDGALVPQDAPTPLETFLNRIARRSVFFGLVLRGAYALTEARPVVRELLLELGRETGRRGERLIVFRIPSRDEPSLAAAIRRRVVSCEGAALAARALYLDPREELMQVPGWDRDFYVPDGHLSAAGNRFMAGFLRRALFPDARGR